MFTTILHMIFFPFKKWLYNTHQERLEAFYVHQAHTYDAYREKLLWGRIPMLSVVSKKIDTDLVWIDFGGGTGWNIEQMEGILGNLKPFKEIILVDLCPSLCKIAQERVNKRNWTNVTVICDDVCTYKAHTSADIVTFSYSLSMMPDYKKALDNASQHIASRKGIIGVADFGIKKSDDKWYSWFWQTFFGLDSVHLDPSIRQHLMSKFSNVIFDEQGYGKVPCMFGAKAPYYIWIAAKT